MKILLSLIFLSITFLNFHLLFAQVTEVVTPIVNLNAPGIVDQDDMCIWISPIKSQSTVITSDKSASKLFVYDLSGNVLQTISVPGKPGNIDIRYNFMIAGQPTDIVGYNDRDNGTIVLYKVDINSRQLSFISNFNDGGMTGGNYGFCLYRSPFTGKFYAIASSNSTQMKQWELVDNGDGTIGGVFERTWDNGSGDITEGLVADDETAKLYCCNEGEGVYKYSAEPTDSTTPLNKVIVEGENGLQQDLEGITIYYAANGEGYIILSSQGNSTFKVYGRKSPHNFVKTIDVVGVGSTDGIDVANINFGSTFSQGIFLTHDGSGSAPYAVTISKYQDLGLNVDTDYWNPRHNNLNKQISIVSPNGGEQFIYGDTLKINWTSLNIDAIGIEFSQDNDLNWFSIIDSIPAGNTQYEWIPPDTISSDQCLVRICDISDLQNCDESDSVFSILQKSLSISSPNGGEQFLYGDTIKIKWTSINIDAIGIEFSQNNGLNWFSIIDNIPAGNNQYKWIPKDTISSDQCLVRICDISDLQNCDESDSVFSILQKSLAISSPNGGEDWQMGSMHNITWTSYNIDNVKLELTLDNGMRWSTIEDSVPSTGTYNWLIPNTPSLQSLIKISDLNNSSINDQSDFKFTIGNVTGVDDKDIPESYALLENYPNPFNPYTIIEYQIPKKSFVTLKVYDVLGNEVATLVDEEKAAGNYELTLNAEKLSSGVYFYQLRADSFVKTRKMVLMR